VIDLIILDVPTGLDDLEPTQALYGFTGPFQSGVDGILDALRSRSL
jgi:hypothetical protein